MKLWLDDIRPVPDDSWTLAENYNDAIELLETYQFDEISLDHDLADFGEVGEKTGYDVLMYMVQMKVDGRREFKNVRVHSMNSVGAPRMRGVIERYL